jgi:hypothetical protein
MPKFDARFNGKSPHPLDHFTFLGHRFTDMASKSVGS